MGETDGLVLVVRQVPRGSSISVGTTIFLLDGVVIGRTAEASARLADATVSREHVAVKSVGGAAVLVNRSASSGLFVDNHPVAPGEPSDPLSVGRKVQIGGVICEVTAIDATMPVRDPLTLGARGGVGSSNAQAEPLLSLTIDGDGCTVNCAGRHLDISNNAARALLALCRAPATVVHEWDIQSEVGSKCNIPQLMSSIRRALLSLVESGALREGAVRTMIEQTGSSDVQELSGAPLLRRFLFARRGHGYALFAPAQAIAIDEAG